MNNTEIPQHSTGDKSPIFIIGTGRSGTTLTRLMLNAHPNIYLADELWFFNWKKRLRKIKDDVPYVVEQYMRTMNLRLQYLGSNRVVPALKANPNLSYADANHLIMQHIAEQHGRKRYGVKEPNITLHLDEVFSEYPNAKVINLVRDPRANVFGHITMPWSTSSLIFSSRWMRLANKKVEQYKDRILSIRLEDLVKSPEATMRQVLEYVEEPWDERVLQHQNYIPANSVLPFPWFQEASQKSHEKKRLWQEQLSPAWIRIIEETNQATMDEYGYTPFPLNQEPSAWEKRLAFARDIPKAITYFLRLIKKERAMRKTEIDDDARQQQLLVSTNPEAWDYHPSWDRSKIIHTDPFLNSLNLSEELK